MTQVQAVVLGFLVIGALVTWLSGRRAAATETRSFKWLEALAALAVGGMAFAWLRCANPAVSMSNEIFLLVSDCLLFGQCFTAGTGSSVVLDNGAVWSDLLLVVRYFHGSTAGVLVAVLTLMAMGVAVTFLVASRFVRPALAVPAAVLAVAFLGFPAIGSPFLDCGSTFLFAASSAAFLLVYALSSHPLALVAAAVFASHAVNAHPSALGLLPALLVLAGMAGRMPLGSVGLAVATYLAMSYVTSAQALIGNWGALTWHHLVPWVALGVVVLGAAGVACNRPYQKLSPHAKGSTVAVLLIGPYLAGVLLLFMIGHPFLTRYLPPVIAPASIVAVLLLAWLSKRLLPRQIWHWADFLVPMAASLYVLSLVPTADVPLLAPRPSDNRSSMPPPMMPSMNPPMPPMENRPMTPMESGQFTPEGVDHLQRLTERIRHGALGVDVTGSSFRPSFQGPIHEGAVRIDVARQDGSSRGFTLLRPPTPSAATSMRYFVLYPDEGITAHDIRQITALVNEVFTTSPWSGNPDSYIPRLHIQGPGGDPVNRGRVVVSVVALFASTMAGLAFLLAMRPRSVSRA